MIVLLAFCAVLMAPLCALAAPEAIKAAPLVIHSEVINLQGEYVVYVFKKDEWEKAGKLSFDKHFRSMEMDLSKYVLGDGNAKIRLVQKGGGAAHIDAVLLGDRPPVEVKGIEDVLALKKLSKKDFDVVDGFQKDVELVFPSGGADKVLRLTARVEGTRISEIPFQFPLSNLYKEMTGNSEFYRYGLMAGGSGPGKKGRPDMSENPFFKEYSVTGSGHPSGFTYGWVRNDDKNLYVTLDFTPDDTMDGDKDYSKVYVKTEEGVKEFKVSVPDTKWGRPDFTYTDKVAYQHKVYDFAIPLKEIGIKDVKKEKELLLAFAAYGTATVDIRKDANGSYDDTFSWTITKDVDKTIVNQPSGNATFNYTVQVSHGDSQVSNVKVTGIITVTNNDGTLEISSVTDHLSDNTICSVTGVFPQSLPPGSKQFGYECDLSNLPSVPVTNTATVSWLQPSGSPTLAIPGGSASSAPVPVTFTANEIDECVSVSDSNSAGPQNEQVCVSSGVNPTTFTYQQTFPVPSSGCATHDNTATFTTNDSGTTGSASQSVEVCNSTGICRTAGFWGTHAGAEKSGQNITQAVLNECGGCLEVCGEVIKNTDPDNADSAVEAICVASKDLKLQLARQLTALSLNCCISGFGSDCDGDPSLRDLFYCCNHQCGATGNPCTETVQSCVNKIDCINSGGIPVQLATSGFLCQNGTCSDNSKPCTSGNRSLCSKPKTATCVPLEDSCAREPLCNEALGLCFTDKQEKIAGSSNACNAANKSPCGVIPPRESDCTFGTKDTNLETCCPAGETLCVTGCENTSTDNNNCGSCGNVCPSGQPTCCGGACVNTQTDTSNCGSCTNACSGGQSCVSGNCECPAGQTLCGSSCVNTQTNNNNCGSCGNGCTGATGTCCSGVCVDTQTNKNHCGSCVFSCPGGVHAACCSGTCVNTQTDNNNCGSCDTICSGATGTCCNSHCVDTSSDSTNCGLCGTVCPSVPNATATCTFGSCGFTCNSHFFNCNGNASDGCECSAGCNGSDCT